jgi:HSP20 family protein
MATWEQFLLPRPAEVRFEKVGAPGDFVLRAEIPGVDPARDIQVSRTGDILRVAVNRSAPRPDPVRTEFHYGQFVGTVVLPREASARPLSATYDRGVLTITGSPDEPRTGHAVPISLVPIRSRPEPAPAG